MNKTQEALKMAIGIRERYAQGICHCDPDTIATISACIKALESQEQEPVACPYPCGWDNLYKITTEKGAYLVTHFDIDNPMPYSYWQEISSMVDTARTLVKWGMNIKSHPAQPLSENVVGELIEDYHFGTMTIGDFVRHVEKAHGIV